MTRDYAKSNRRSPPARNSRVKPSRRSTPGWAWLLAGIFIGTLVTGILRFSGDEQPEAVAETPVPDPEALDLSQENAGHKPRFDFYTLLKESEVIVPDENGQLPTAKPAVIPEPQVAAPTDTAAAEGTPPDPAPAKALTETPRAAAVSPPPVPTTAATGEPPAEPEAKPQPSPEPQPSRQPPPTEPAAAKEVYLLQAGSFRNADDADSVRVSLLLLNMHASIEKVTTAPGETWHRVLVGPFTTTAELGSARTKLTQNGIDSIQVKRRL
jgi:cell division protein FtsN